MHAVTKRVATSATAGLLLVGWVVATPAATHAETDPSTAPAVETAVGGDALARELLDLEDRFAARAVVEGAAFTSVQDVVDANDDEKLVMDSLGNVTRLSGTFRRVEDDFRSLYERAERAGGPVGGAVGDAARAWIVVGHGLALADKALSHDLALAREAYDDDQVAVGADYAGGLVDTALRTVMEGNDRLSVAHAALADAPLDEPLQAHFTARTVDWQDYRAVEEPLYAALLSEPSTQVLVGIERFVSTAVGTEARARSVAYACADRDAHGALADATPAAPADALVALDVTAAPGNALDCPALPRTVVDGD